MISGAVRLKHSADMQKKLDRLHERLSAYGITAPENSDSSGTTVSSFTDILSGYIPLYTGITMLVSAILIFVFCSLLKERKNTYRTMMLILFIITVLFGTVYVILYAGAGENGLRHAIGAGLTTIPASILGIILTLKTSKQS